MVNGAVNKIVSIRSTIDTLVFLIDNYKYEYVTDKLSLPTSCRHVEGLIIKVDTE